MSEVVTVAIIASIAPTVASIAALYVAWSNGKTQGRKADEIIEKAEVIHTLVNSQMTKVTADLSAAIEHVKSLEALIVRMKETK